MISISGEYSRIQSVIVKFYSIKFTETIDVSSSLNYDTLGESSYELERFWANSLINGDMKSINTNLVWRGKTYKLKYSDLNSFDNLPYQRCQQVYGVCFYGNKMVIVKGGSGANGKGWGLVGGHIENGETFEQTLIREVQEETNMRVLKSIPIGVQKVISPQNTVEYQLRYYTIVEPIGKFEKDPDGSVTKIKLIDPKDYRKYFDWGEIGEKIVQRALELKDSLNMTIDHQ